MIVGVGGGLGALSRNTLSLLGSYHAFPVNFFVINVLGSLLIGMVMALNVELGILSTQWRLFWGVGVLGGFTTFSTFMLGVHNLWTDVPAISLLYLIGTLLAGLIAAFLGLVSIRQLAAVAYRRAERKDAEDDPKSNL